MASHGRGRPFIWQDEMTEVRETFRRVARVKRSAFAGFSLWDTDSPTAETLSRNRLRRRRAQYAFELTHLNYKEPPYEAFTHLHNIRGMCNRIQRLDSVTERKKKDVDLDSQPALLRRPLTASSSHHREREKMVPDRLRPHSAPLPALAQIPLQYSPPKPTMLYDVTHKCARTKELARSKFGAEISSSLSASPSRNHDKIGPESDTPSPGCEASGRASPISGFCTENYGKPPRPHRTDSPVPRFDCMKSKCVSMASQIVDIRPPSRMAERPVSVANLERPASRNLVDRLPLEKIKQERSRNLPREVEKESPFTSTDHPTTSNDDLTSSDVEDSSELTRSVFSDSESLGSKGLHSRPESRKGNARDRHNKLSYCEQESSSELPNSENYLGPVLESNSATSSSPTRKSPPLKTSQQRSLFEPSAPRPFTAGGVVRQHNKALKQGDIHEEIAVHTKQRVKFASPSRKPVSRTQAGNKHGASRALLRSAPSGEVKGLEMLHRPPPEAVEDSHVLIKHSSDPYVDFKNSMLHMIREERLQNRSVELEELFQYYLDLNPSVHHDVLKRVIKDIRAQVATAKAF